MWRERRLTVMLVLASFCGLARSSAADPAGDQAYLKRLTEHVKELQGTAALFEQYRRVLELVSLEFASLELPLADPSASPEQIVRDLLATSFPRVSVTMSRISTRAPPNVEIWKWRCTLVGAVEELRLASQLLQQRGLFVLPGPSEPVTLDLDGSQRRGTLTFVGHHVRLQEARALRLPPAPAGPDLLAHRNDLLAQEIRRLRLEVTTLSRRVSDVLTFEARVESMRFIIAQLKVLTGGAQAPFRVFAPLLDLELVLFERLVHRGEEVTIQAAAPSESAREAATRWFSRQRRLKSRYRTVELRLLYGAATPRELPLAAGDAAGGARRARTCALGLSGARPLDLGAASSASAVVTYGSPQDELSGNVARAPLRRGLEAAARGGGLELVWEQDALLVVPRAAAAGARRALAAPAPGGGRFIALRQTQGTAAEALALLQHASGQTIAAPARALADGATVALSGRASLARWLRLLGAGLGLRVTRGPGWQLQPEGSTAATLVPVARATLTTRSTTELDLLAELQPRVLLSCVGPVTAIVSAPDRAPLLVRVGTPLGRGRHRVTRIDHRGVMVRWSAGGDAASVLLPFGERRRAPPLAAPVGPAPPARPAAKR